MKGFGQKFVEVFNYGSSFSQGWIRRNDISSNSYSISSVRSVRDIDENAVKNVQEVAVFDAPVGKWKTVSAVVLQGASKPVMIDISKSSRYIVNFFNNGVGTAGTKKDSGSYIEVLDQEAGSYRIDTSSFHGKIIGDSWFGGCSWSYDERFIIYVAQTSDSTIASTARKTVIESLANKDLAEDSTLPKNKFDYIEDWGEKYVDVSELGLFVFDLQERRVVPLPLNNVKEFTLGQPIFINATSSNPSSTLAACYCIAYTAWDVKPRRLGMIYCYQRKSSIWIGDITSALAATTTSPSTTTTPTEAASLPHWKVSSGIEIARSPRSSIEGKTLVFLGNEKGFLSHNGCSELFAVDLSHFLNQSDPVNRDSTSSSFWSRRTVVSEVSNPKTNGGSSSSSSSSSSSFPGLFLDALPRQCFLSEEEIVCSSIWESRETILKVSLVTQNHVTPILFWQQKAEFEEAWKEAGFTILDVTTPSTEERQMMILGQISSPTAPAQLMVLDLQLSVQSVLGPMPRLFSVTSKYLPASLTATTAMKRASPFDHITWQVFRHETDNIAFNSILIAPSTKSSSSTIPLIVVPHGGPHSCLTNSFVSSYLYLIEVLGAAILYVNYRGSTGFGQASIESLMSYIGRNDVADIMTALRHALDLHQTQFDRNRVGIIGGSHGGFLSSHMCGQYPEVFKVCCLRNPVTNIPAMASVTDIPDWCHVEAGTACKDLSRGGIKAEELAVMKEASPIAHIERYEAPTLLCLGAKDRRVPVSQGIEFYHLLQGKGVPSRLMIFPEDVHAIDSPTAESEHWIAIAQWLATYL